MNKKNYDKSIDSIVSNNRERLKEEAKRYSKSLILKDVECERRIDSIKSDCNKKLASNNASHQEYVNSLLEYHKQDLEYQLYQKDERIKDLEINYDEALKESEETLRQAIETADRRVGEVIRNVYEKNTLPFYCACNPQKPILVSIDLSKENTFICPECGANYRIEINAYPIMVGHPVNPEKITEAVNKIMEGGNQ